MNECGTPMTGKSHTFWLAASLVVVLDVITKYVDHSQLRRHLPLEVLGKVQQFALSYNPGAAFGLHVGPYSRLVFVAVAILALGVLWRLYRSGSPDDRLRAIALGLISGGALENLLNRLWSAPGVVDFIDVGVGEVRWPTFNLADIGVSVGAILLAWSLAAEDRAPTVMAGGAP